MPVPVIVAAGDRRAAKAVYGDSKVYLEIQGQPLVSWVVESLQSVPEVGEVWVVGNAERLEAVFARPEFQAKLVKPLHVVGQFRSLYENGWQTYRRLLPGGGAEGRDPGPDDEHRRVLFISGDVPLATPEEISDFVQRSMEADCAYALGLGTAESLEAFAPEITPALFNLREGRFRQSNLHFIRPAWLTNRHYIEEMYEHRYQKEWGNVLALAWRLLWSEQGGPTVVWYYGLMHFAGFLSRHKRHGLADRVRHWIPTARIERGVTGLLGGGFRLIVTEGGGCAIDVDSEGEYDAMKANFDRWRAEQRERAQRLYGHRALPAAAKGGSEAASGEASEGGEPG